METLRSDVQQLIFDEVSDNSKLALLKIGDTDFEIMFDHECAVRLAPEVMVADWNIFKAMVDVSKITKLHLSSNFAVYGPINRKINDDDTQQLVNRINDCKSLRILDLGGNDLTDAFGVAFGKAVATHATLATLDLAANKFGEETGVALGKALTTNTSLHTLTLWNNKLREKGIIRGLKNNTTLQELNLSTNNLGENFGVAIQDDLANSTWLHTLNLVRNNMGETSGVAIAKALTMNTTLKHLKLFCINLSDVKELSQNSTLGLDYMFNVNNDFSPATRPKIKFALSPELKGLLNTPSISPSRIPVCVVGFDNVGKTELVNTWHRTTAHDNPHLDLEETAEAKPGRQPP